MKRASYLCCLMMLLAWPISGFARIFPWDGYGPACQWMRLIGEVERPEGIPKEKPLSLTVTYRLPEQKVPVTLLTNYPIRGNSFFFILSGFRTDIQGALFVPPMFFFTEKIEFQYFITTMDRHLTSSLKQITYHPERTKRDGKVYCQTALHLEKLTMDPR